NSACSGQTRAGQPRHMLRTAWIVLFVFAIVAPALAQKKRTPKTAAPKATKKTPDKPVSELDKLRDEYINATKDYKASLGKLLPLYEKQMQEAQERAAASKKLYEDGLISRTEVEKTDRAVFEAKIKIDDVHKQMEGADSQVAQVLVEVETEKELAKM